MKRTQSHRPDKRTDTIKSHHIEEHRHDPYKSRGKLPEPAECPSCHLVFLDGRWQRAKQPPKDAHRASCPACQRIADNFPAGEMKLTGTFVAAHSDEIVSLVRNTEAKEQSEHPLQRLMGIDERDRCIIVTTTDIHLPRRIAHALAAAYKGRLDTHYDEAGYFVRIGWHRDD